MNENDIADKRNIKEFRGITFSKYKKADAKKELLNNLNTGRQRPGSTGTQTSALIYGGYAPGSIANTEEWNGTNWTETTDLSTARSNVGSAGADNTNALAAGGSGPTAATEEWTGAGAAQTRTFTDS